MGKNKNKSYWKSEQEVAMLLITRPAKTEKGRKVQAAVLFRLDTAIAIADALSA